MGKEHMRPFYWVAKTATYIFFKVFYRISATGYENLPKSGGYIVASNHASQLDPPAIGSIFPGEMAFFAKKELFSFPLLRWFLTYAGSIPVDRKGYSAGAVREIIKALRSGKRALFFPEGTRTRTGDFLKPKKGVGMVALASKVPVVPCWIEGSYHAKPFRSKITVHFLEPFDPCGIEADEKKEQYLLVSERIMHDIIRLHDMHRGRVIEAESTNKGGTLL